LNVDSSQVAFGEHGKFGARHAMQPSVPHGFSRVQRSPSPVPESTSRQSERRGKSDDDRVSKWHDERIFANIADYK
jgi:hypothetical protein